MSVSFRPAVAADAAFLNEMLVQAAFWRPEMPRGSIDDVLHEPELAHDTTGWPRPGDLGVFAESDQPVGAAWLRFFTAVDPGYGFVDAATPELSMGLVPEFRSQGVGARLLDEVIAAAREVDLDKISLSVEPENCALRLYKRRGSR